MEWDITVYTVIMAIPTLVSAGVAVYAWRHREVRGGTSLAVLMIAASIFAGATAIESAAVGVPAKVFWSKIQYLGSMTAPVLFLLFALEFARFDRWLNARTGLSLLIVPALIIGLAWTNESHHLIWTGFYPSLVGENLLIYDHGSAFWFAIIYVYAIMALGMVVLIRNLRHSVGIYRGQALAVMLAGVVAWVGSAIYIFPVLNPIPGLDWTPISFVFMGAALAWSISQYRLLDLVPVARSAMVTGMDDGVVVVDQSDRVIYLNPAAQRFLPIDSTAIGQPAETVFATQPELVDHLRGTSTDRVAITCEVNGQHHYLDVHVSLLTDRRGRATGRLLVLRDVTDYKRIEQQARQSEDQLRRVIDLVPNLIFAKDREGRYVLVNQAAAEVYGLTVEQIIGKTDAECAVSPADAEHFRETDLQIIDGHLSRLVLDEQVTNSRGQVRYLQTTKIPFPLADSAQPAVLGVAVDMTERRRAEDALITSEALYHTLVETLPVNIFRKDLAGRFTFVNQRCCRSLHRSLDDIIGRTDFDLHPPELAEKYRADDRRIIESGQTFETIESYQPKDGETTWVQTFKTPVLAADGRIVGVQGMFWDIGERKRTDDLLAQRAREMTALYETAVEINTQVDLPTLLLSIVRRSAELLGARMGGLYLMKPDGQTLELVVSYNLPGNFIGTQLKLGEGLSGLIAQTGQTLVIEDYAAWAGRAAVYAHVQFRRVLGIPLKVSGRLIGVVNISDDQQTGRYSDDEIRLASLLADQAAIAIDRMRLLDETLQRAERLALLNRLARAISSTLNLNDLLEIIRREIMQIMAAETFFVALYDAEARELDFRIRVDRDVREPPERRPLREGITGLVVTSRRPLLIRDLIAEQNRLPQVHIWGTGELALSVICVPMLLGEKVVGVISVQAYHPYAFSEAELELLSTIADTIAVAVENARLFDASQHHAEDLEQRVTDRTQELTEAYEHLRDLDRLKDQFISRISHELRTPLANIQLYLNLLDAGKPDKRPEYVQTLRNETVRLNKLIEDMLAISQLDTGQMTIQVGPLDLNRLVHNLCPDWTAAATEHDLVFRFDPAANLKPVLADATLLTRALSNLASNAFNYTPRGGSVICRTAACVAAGIEWVTVAVDDTGPGISAEERPHLFERFYRGRAARNYKVPGTGLGLAMAREIIDKLAGRITVDNHPGATGVTFTVWLRPA